MRPQFKRRRHRACVALEHAGQMLPGIWQDYEAARIANPPPRHVYITDEAGELAHAAAMRRNHSPPGALPADAYTTLAAWRMTQGIYRIDPALYDALITTDLAGDIPANVLMRLPEWC